MPPPATIEIPPAAVRGRGQSGWGDRLFAHRLELLALAIGFAVRFLTLSTFDPAGGYDFPDHWMHLNWYLNHFSITPNTYTRTAYHAPLYHFLAGMGRRLGLAKNGLQLASTVIACLRITLIAVGLNLALPASPRARAIALLLAAVLPCSVHLDGMVTQEPLNNMLVVLALVLILMVFRAPPGRRGRWAALAGFATGLALLTKISSLALAALLVSAGPLEAVVVPAATWRARVVRAWPWILAVLAMCAVSGWWYVRSQIVNGKPFVSGWDLGIDGGLGPAGALPTLDRRTLGYVTMWTAEIYKDPHYPAGSGPHPRFWPVLMASTFVDYYKYNFARPSLKHAAELAQISVIAGTYIMAVTVTAWISLMVFLLRRRAIAPVVALMLPMLGVLGQLSFAIQFPYDWEGVVKGLYLHFSVAPLYAVFGVAVVWLWRRRAGRPFAALAVVSLLGVASYTICCRWWS